MERGRPRWFGLYVRKLICRVARTGPQQAGRPFTTWSLTKLVEHLRQQHRVAISAETVPSTTGARPTTSDWC
jgi:hypothetical protein